MFGSWGGWFRSWTRAGRRSAEARRRRPWMERALAGINEALIVNDPEGRVLFLNAIAEALTGWTQSSAAGRPLAEVLRLADEQTRKPLESPVFHSLEEDAAARWVRHTLLIRKDGEMVPIEYRVATFRGDADQIGGALVLVRGVAQGGKGGGAMEGMAAIVGKSADSVNRVAH